jgi:hypothetical protein
MMNENDILDVYKHLFEFVAGSLLLIQKGRQLAVDTRNAEAIIEFSVLAGFFLAIGDRLMLAMKDIETSKETVMQ